MDTTKAQQSAFNDALVAPGNRLKIGKCNYRLSSIIKSNEPTLQVVLDALKLAPFYKAFQITVEVQEIYMQEFWATVSIHHTSLRFKMNNKSYTLNLENLRDMLQICPKLPVRTTKDLKSLSLDELIGNLKVYEMIIKKDSEIVKTKVERKSIALKAKKESSNKECLTSGSEDEESRDDKNGKSDRKCFRCGDPNHFIGECPKPPKDKNQRAFVRDPWSYSSEEDDEKVKDETWLVASSDVCSESSYFSDENSSIDDLALDNEYDKI
nr:zf-CCHC domain-containing protein/UBN2 domain-containing protein [Tanacetum cinerariifolium]